MFRSFYTSAERVVDQWLGYARESLSPAWKTAVEKFTEPGGGAESGLGIIKSVNIKLREEGPVHKSHYNLEDKADVISIRIEGEKDTDRSED